MHETALALAAIFRRGGNNTQIGHYAFGTHPCPCPRPRVGPWRDMVDRSCRYQHMHIEAWSGLTGAISMGSHIQNRGPFCARAFPKTGTQCTVYTCAMTKSFEVAPIRHRGCRLAHHTPVAVRVSVMQTHETDGLQSIFACVATSPLAC